MPIGTAYLVDYDSATGTFSNWTSFEYPNGTNFATQFQGISSAEKGVYTLSADSLQAGSDAPAQGSWVTVRRNTDGSFSQAEWVDLNYAGYDPQTNLTSSNSVYGNQVVGIVLGETDFAFQATVNTSFQLSNVISGNLANGIGLYGADDNQIAMNFVGTDATGTLDLGNGENGILITSESTGNLIGGEATGGNDPTNDVFVRPPQGNLVSGNDANGVLIDAGATDNQLSGNFIGTTASGSAALGNALDGVAIEEADDNSLIGCTFEQNPFVFYNVISGNGENGLRITDADDTTVQANFLGIGADNATAVANAKNGLLVAGSSAHTTVGGPIPLGNVIAANSQNGIVVQDTASYFTSYNTFCGLAAFSDDTSFGNGQNGMLITSSGGDILIRTNVVTSNGDNGIEVSGNASGVRIVGNIIGLNTNGTLAMGNVNNGVEVGGSATDIVIGGPQPTFNVIPQNTISANGGYGVAIVGTAHDISVNHSYIGTAIEGDTAIGNSTGGVLLGSGTYSNSIGSTDSTLKTVISGNLGNGVTLQDTYSNEIVGTNIGTDAGGTLPLGNLGSGVSIVGSYGNLVGVQLVIMSQRLNMASYLATDSGNSEGAANQIAFNGGAGVVVQSGSSNTISGNSIRGNTAPGISLTAGANLDMPAPVLNSVVWTTQGVHVSGTLNASANSEFVVQFFANVEDESSGDNYLGQQSVFTDGSGAADFEFDSSLAPDTADFVTATATDPLGNTSEFSLALS